jgi:hypothetical protein
MILHHDNENGLDVMGNRIESFLVGLGRPALASQSQKQAKGGNEKRAAPQIFMGR